MDGQHFEAEYTYYYINTRNLRLIVLHPQTDRIWQDGTHLQTPSSDEVKYPQTRTLDTYCTGHYILVSGCSRFSHSRRMSDHMIYCKLYVKELKILHIAERTLVP